MLLPAATAVATDNVIPPGAPIRVALAFHSMTSGNLGVGALTVANMAIAERVAKEAGLAIEFVSVGMRDGDVPAIGGGRVPTVFIDRRALTSGALWRAVGAADCVLDISGGDSFTDIYGAKRLFFIFAIKLIAIIRRVPLVLSPMTIGPFDKSRNQRVAAAIMRRARAVVARDDKSFDYARRIAPSAPIIQATDVAFELPFESRAGERGGSKLRVGINASGLLFREAETASNRFGLSIDYAVFTRQLIELLGTRGDVEVHLVPHVLSPSQPLDDDAALAARLKGEFPDIVVAPAFTHPSEAKSYISSLDLLIAGRMHACIGAFSAGTPVVPVAYSRKFAGLFGTLGYNWMIPVTGMDTGAALDFVTDALERRTTLAEDEARGMRQVTALLDNYRDALRGLFRDIMSRR